MGVDLAVDGGQSGLRMAVARRNGAGLRLERPVDVPGFSWGAGVDPAQAQGDVILRAWRELGAPSPIDTIACGLSGLSADSRPGQELAVALGTRLDARRVLVAGDDVTTHAGALGGHPGVVLAAGTGVVCTGIDASGRLVRVDAWGYLLGDTGGGSWLGREGLRAALDGHDGRHAATKLTARAVDRYGDLRDFVHRLLVSPTLVAEVAAFAREVLACAREGDEVAAAICARAADELCATAAATVRRGFPGAAPGEVPFTWTGSILTATDVVRTPMLAHLAERCPAASPRNPLGGGLDGAALLAVGAAETHLDQTCRWDAP
ncbi:MAG: ATPase [Streptosporangiales bacterium]|nr:ATPase [Streptosporangiales bacterium]